MTLCLSMYSHMYYVSGQYNSSMNNKHLSLNKEINNNFIIASRAYFLQRAHARATETEVDSFLFKLHLVSYESRVLPQIETLCLVRYQGDYREDTRTEIQATMEREERSDPNKEDRRPLDNPGARTWTSLITHKCRGSQQLSRVEYSTQMY